MELAPAKDPTLQLAWNSHFAFLCGITNVSMYLTALTMVSSYFSKETFHQQQAIKNNTQTKKLAERKKAFPNP